MTWQGIEGHDAIAEQFRSSIQRGRLGSTFLFVGPPGIGKRLFATQLAKCLLCQRHQTGKLLACGVCSACQQVEASSHPDLLTVSKPADKKFIPISLLIGDGDHRMREGLCHEISLKPFAGGRKIAILDDADQLNAEGANCLLKTLEEPPPQSLIILIGTSGQRQLPTIRSRCQIVRFAPLPQASIGKIILEAGLADSAEAAESLAAVSDGSLEQAARLQDPGLLEFKGEVTEILSRPLTDSLGLATAILDFVEQAGTDAAARRRRLRFVMDATLEFYRSLFRSLVGTDRGADSVGTAADGWSGGTDRAARCVDRCLDGQAQLDANAHLPTLIDCWIDDLAAIQKEGNPDPIRRVG